MPGARMSAPLAQIALDQLKKLDHYNGGATRTPPGWTKVPHRRLRAPARVAGSTPTFLRFPVLVRPEMKHHLRSASRSLASCRVLRSPFIFIPRPHGRSSAEHHHGRQRASIYRSLDFEDRWRPGSPTPIISIRPPEQHMIRIPMLESHHQGQPIDQIESERTGDPNRARHTVLRSTVDEAEYMRSSWVTFRPSLPISASKYARERTRMVGRAWRPVQEHQRQQARAVVVEVRGELSTAWSTPRRRSAAAATSIA